MRITLLNSFRPFFFAFRDLHLNKRSDDGLLRRAHSVRQLIELFEGYMTLDYLNARLMMQRHGPKREAPTVRAC